MPNDTSSAATAVAVESPDGAAVSVGRERRVTEQLINNDWQEETRRLGHALAFMTLNTSAMTDPKWAHRFIIAVGGDQLWRKVKSPNRALIARGTGSSNPSPSSGESANFRSLSVRRYPSTILRISAFGCRPGGSYSRAL